MSGKFCQKFSIKKVKKFGRSNFIINNKIIKNKNQVRKTIIVSNVSESFG